MKKLFIITLMVILIFLLATCSCSSEDVIHPYNTVERVGWDIYATLDCFVKTEYNKEGNPLSRYLYSTETFENGLTIFYQYDEDGYLCELTMNGKDSQNEYFKNLRFELSFGEDNLTQTARPLHGSQVYERVSFTWDENRKLVSELVKPSYIADFTYDENGGITKEHYSEATEDLTHRYNEDGSGILVTELDSLVETLSLTFGENGMPASVKRADYTTEYTYNEKNLCTKIDIKALGVTAGDVVITYDENGNPAKREIHTHEGGETTLVAGCEYAYDAFGNLTRETVWQVNADLELLTVSDSEYSYNEKGEMLAETHGNYTAAGKMTAKRHTDYEYDKAGNRIASTSVKTNPSGSFIKSKSSERYYTNGKLLSYTTYSFHTNHTLNETFEIEYTEDRLVLKKTTRSYWEGKKEDGVLVDGKLRSVWIVEYTDNEELSGTLYKEYTKDGFLSSKQSTTYTDGTQTSYVSMQYYTNGSVYEKKTTEYFANGKVKYSETEVYDQNGVVSDRMSTENDENGNMLKWTHLQMGGTEKAYEQVHEYTYYDNGMAKTIRQSQFYGGVLKYVYDFNFNTDDFCEKDVKTEYQNGKIVKVTERFNADGKLQKTIVYEYDENGNEISREETLNP